jgi:ATP diphosphatase
MSEALAQMARLLEIMARLRDPRTGCPWDVAQNFASVAPYTIEEAYEVADAIARNDLVALPDELGDLLFQVVFYARMGEEAGHFGFADIARAISDKMVRRHPHVFAPAEHLQAGMPEGAWEAGKEAERKAREEHGVLAGIPVGLPALTRATKLCARAARVKFDWADAELVLQKLEEEIAELRAEFSAADPARLADELGDMFFVMANLARKLGLDAETCARGANDKFTRRFNAVEQALASEGRTPADASLEEMEALWAKVKRQERRVIPAEISTLGRPPP